MEKEAGIVILPLCPNGARGGLFDSVLLLAIW